MRNIEHGPERIDVGVAHADGAYWLWRDIIEPTKPVFEKVEYVRADVHRGAVSAITEWLRSDEAEALREQYEHEGVAPEDGFAHEIEHRFGGQSETPPAVDDSGLTKGPTDG